MRQGSKWGYLNTKGELVLPYQFEEAQSFQGEWASLVSFIEEQGYD